MAAPTIQAAATVRITLRGGFRIHQLEKVVSALEPLVELDAPTAVVLDLRGLAFIGPAALATLVSVIHDAIARGVVLAPSVYMPPANRLVARYLDRIDFNRLLTGSDVGAEFKRRPAEGFRPVQQFSSADEVATVAESLTMAATEAVAVGSTDRSAVFLAIREIGQNVVDHANSRMGGFAMAQRSTKRQEFEIAVADAGVGIAGSLRGNADYANVASDSSAIGMALMPGVTGKPGTSNRGLALAAIQGLLRENLGTLLIRSGTAALEDGRNQDTRDNLALLPGTVVAIRLRIDQPITFGLFSQAGAKAQARSASRSGLK
jgi:anti-anti-sigma regulatory factor/anti-sigma regulatory factor (Ser/Thr protein kinase)